MEQKRIAVLASGSGTNLQAIIDATSSGRINGRVVCVISDRRGAYALERARRSGIEAIYVKHGDGFENAVDRALESHSPDIVVLAGFMRILPGWLVSKYVMVNIHPSLLPCFGGPGFYGRRVHRAVIDSGAMFSGCTVHLVTPDVDRGPIILQKVVEVSPDDTEETLEEKIHPLEHEAIVEALASMCSMGYVIRGNRVIFRSG